MARLHLDRFEGMIPAVQPELLPKNNAQIAHNCLLTDGRLRPYPEWVLEGASEYVNQGKSSISSLGIAYDARTRKAYMYPLADPVSLQGAPFALGATVGGLLPDEYLWELGGIHHVATGANLQAQLPDICMLRPPQVNASVTYQRAYDSDKPVNRIYAVSMAYQAFGSINEGPLTVLPGQAPTDIVYEGDLVTVDMGVAQNYYSFPLYINLYRSISGLDTGETVTNELDTNWHLVTRMNKADSYIYIDGDSATVLPLDVYHAAEYHPITFKAQYFGLTESGWFVAAEGAGNIAVSERYKYHAWPTRNYASIPDTITDFVVTNDNAYIGTEQQPYIMSIASGENAAQIGIKPYEAYLPCRPNSMYAAPGGAMYSSRHGVVALSREGANVITKEILGAGTVISEYYNYDTDMSQRVSTDEVTYGAYHDGNYYGFCCVLRPYVPPIGT